MRNTGFQGTDNCGLNVQSHSFLNVQLQKNPSVIIYVTYDERQLIEHALGYVNLLQLCILKGAQLTDIHCTPGMAGNQQSILRYSISRRK